jgi:septal ring-binding cell division protein DamX
MSVNSEKGSSKADTLIKVVLVFFISLLSFTVGTFVGNQLSKSEERRLALEGQDKAERSVASTGDADDEKISEKEVESLTEEFVNKEKAGAKEPVDDSQEEVSEQAEHAEHKAAPDAEGYKAVPRANVKAAAAKPAAHEEHAEEAKADAHAPAKTPAAKAAAKPAPKAAAHKADAPHEAAEKVSKDEAPTDGAKEARKPTSALPAVASSAIGKYTVQVASYADENEAKNHAATLKGKGWSAFYVPATVQGRTWYRVSVGIYDSNKAATEARAQFMKDTNSKSALVQKIVQ